MVSQTWTEILPDRRAIVPFRLVRLTTGSYSTEQRNIADKILSCLSQFKLISDARWYIFRFPKPDEFSIKLVDPLNLDQ